MTTIVETLGQAHQKRMYPWLQLLLLETKHHNDVQKLVLAVGEGAGVAEIYDKLVAMEKVRSDTRRALIEKIYDQLHLLDTALMKSPYDRKWFTMRQSARRMRQKRLGL